MDRQEERFENTGAGPTEPGAKVYLAPSILWEQEFVALALVSMPPCDPYSDPNCSP